MNGPADRDKIKNHDPLRGNRDDNNRESDPRFPVPDLRTSHNDSVPEIPQNVRIVTLGCAKNEVDSEEIAGVLRSSGYSVDGSADAAVTVINTCGFLESAKQESIAAIKKAVAEKGTGKVIVAGCLAQRLGEE